MVNVKVGEIVEVVEVFEVAGYGLTEEGYVEVYEEFP